MPPEHVRRLVAQLHDISTSAVVHAELSGAQHSFDLFHSIRFEILIDGMEAFAAWTRSHARTRNGSGAEWKRRPHDHR